jgi:hypothetical protein
MVRSFKILFLFSVLLSCQSPQRDNSGADLLEINALISLMEYDLKDLEQEITELASFSQQLFEEYDGKVVPELGYTIVKKMANVAPNADPEKSTIWISDITPDIEAVKRIIAITNPIDERFKSIVKNYKVVAQVYFNSPLQLNRLYPPFDAATMFEPNLDVNTFNFFFMADEIHNPEKGPVWLSDIYIDPVGKGWMISLLHPVYYNDQLQFVLGFDITVNDIIESYLNQSTKNLLIVDETGTVVAGKSKAIEALYLPPLKNHTYLQTITSDSYRREDFNLFKSRSIHVRRMASNFILERKDQYKIADGVNSIEVIGAKMKVLPWYVLEIKF